MPDRVPVTVRRELPEDFDAVHDVVATAFGSPAEATLVRNIRASSLYRPDSSLVAVSGTIVVGHVMISTAHIQNSSGRWAIAMLSPLAVTPDRQRQGIGDALVRTACEVADKDGEPMVLLQGSPAYYGRFGFVPSADHGITMELPEWAPPEAAQVLRLDKWTGGLRGELIMPPAFDGPD